MKGPYFGGYKDHFPPALSRKKRKKGLERALDVFASLPSCKIGGGKEKEKGEM